MSRRIIRHVLLSSALPASLAACGSGADQPRSAIDTPAIPTAPLTEAIQPAVAHEPDAGSIASLAARVGPSVVNITVRQSARAPGGKLRIPGFGGIPFGPQGPPRAREGAGSGFIIDEDGKVLTNAHVVRNAEKVVVRLKDDREFEARVVGRDDEMDIALLQIDGAGDLPAVSLGDSQRLRVGEHVMAVGNPFGLGHTVTLGIVSAKARTIGAGPYDDFIQTDASINPGNSGGPLFNLRGEVVGINTAIRAGAEGIGFAIPAADVNDVLPQLEAKGYVERGHLGVRFQPIDAALAKALGLDRPHGALVTEVQDDSPAAEAGLRSGDVILSVAGRRVRRAAQLPRLVARHAPGKAVDIDLLRPGAEPAEQRLTATLAAPPDAPSGPAPGVEAPDVSEPTPWGFRVTPSPKGLLVQEVDDPASNLKPGDVILSVAGAPVGSVEALRRELDAVARDVVLLRVRREGRVRFVAIERAPAP